MFDVSTNQRRWIVNRVAVCRQQSRRGEVQHSPQGLEVLRKTPTLRRKNDDSRPRRDEVGRKQRSRRGVPERHVIRSMARRVHNLEFGVSGRDDLAVRKGLPRHGMFAVTLGPRKLREQGVRPATSKRTDTGDVIAMGVAHDDASRAGGRSFRNVVEVSRQADSRIDEHWMTARKEVRPVASTRERARIGGVNRDNQKNTFRRP